MSRIANLRIVGTAESEEQKSSEIQENRKMRCEEEQGNASMETTAICDFML